MGDVKLVQIILFPRRVPFPGGTFDGTEPVVRWLPGPVYYFCVAPHVILVVRLDSLYALFEPFVLVGAVIRHEVENYSQSKRLRLRNESVEIGQSAVILVYVGLIRDVIAKIELRTGVDRRQP